MVAFMLGFLQLWLQQLSQPIHAPAGLQGSQHCRKMHDMMEACCTFLLLPAHPITLRWCFLLVVPHVQQTVFAWHTLPLRSCTMHAYIMMCLFQSEKWTPFNSPQHSLPLHQLRLVHKYLTRRYVAMCLGVQPVCSNQHSLHCLLQYKGSTKVAVPRQQYQGSSIKAAVQSWYRAITDAVH